MTTLNLATAALLPAETVLSSSSGAALQAGYGVSFTDLGAQAAFDKAVGAAAGRLEARGAVAPAGETMRAIFAPLEQLNGEAASLSAHAKTAMEAGESMTPGEMVMLTVRCQEFLFHSQLTSNIANRSADGLQQLFRQQA